MKKILGLDLGVTSVGSALIETDDKNIPIKILHLGARIIPLSPDDETQFSRGNAITKNQDRTTKRQTRRGNDRYKMRRRFLAEELNKNGMLPDQTLIKLPVIELYALRERALTEKLSLPEIGRIFYHLNQKRGYKSSKAEQNKDDGKITEYETKINNRNDYIKSIGKTVGQYFSQQLKSNSQFRAKEKVFPRDAYIEEFNAIWHFQSKFYQSILNDALLKKIRDEIIFYQRSLKSQKGLVSVCEFEGKWYKNKEGKEIFSGPKVAPKSSPLFQVCKVWESINNISIKRINGETRSKEDFDLSPYLQQIFEYLDTHERLSQAELFKICGIKKDSGYNTDALVAKKGIQGNLTKAALLNILKDEELQETLLQFNLKSTQYSIIDKNTGELIERLQIVSDIEKQPLYQLWHVIYSLPEKNEIIKKLQKDFGVNEELANQLANIDFSRGGFGNKSAKAIRKILPYLQKGHKYSDACLIAGYNHSDSLTKEENDNRLLKDELTLLQKGSLRQPIVEKILNQTINVVNAIIEKYGRPDEIRIELARELKQSKEERNETFKALNAVEKEHDRIRKLLYEHPEFKKKKVSRNDIIRYKLWQEFENVSPYEPDKIISFGEVFNGLYDVEHIIPKSLLFDDSFGNKTLCPRHLNSGEFAKNQMTAFDFMKSRTETDFQTFLEFVNRSYKEKKIGKKKFDRLLMSEDGIPKDFIARQLRETQYIARKSREILQSVCKDVWVTSGKITEHIRHLWGWDNVLMNIHLPKFREIGKTEVIEFGSNGSTEKREMIVDWSKRDDHRHHAIDALTVACTQQGFIQRLNTLNAKQTRDEMFNEIKNKNFKEKLSVLDKYLLNKKPFDTSHVEEEMKNTLVAFKSGKKVATWGRRIEKRDGKKVKVQSRIIVPRGALSEESVYGKIKMLQRNIPIKKLFEIPDRIVKPYIRKLIKDRISENEGDLKKSIASLKKNPLWMDEEKKEPLQYATVYSEQYVIKYPLQSINAEQVSSIVDEAVKKAVSKRLDDFKNNSKEAFKDLENNPVWLNEVKKIPIKTVRCFTGANVIEPIKVQDESNGIEYEKYVKPGSNHHIAIYTDAEGKRQEHVATFWHAVERKKFGLPVVITNPKETWSTILSEKKELPQSFLEKLPSDDLKFETSMQQNELFVFNMDKEELKKAIERKEYDKIGPNIFRVRKLTSGAYWFNQLYETTPRESTEDKKAGRSIQASLSTMTGIRIKIDILGEIQSDLKK